MGRSYYLLLSVYLIGPWMNYCPVTAHGLLVKELSNRMATIICFSYYSSFINHMMVEIHPVTCL